jgi:hypothetical protein
MLGKRQKILNWIGHVALVMMLYGCGIVSQDKIEPPAKKQTEEEYITKPEKTSKESGLDSKILTVKPSEKKSEEKEMKTQVFKTHAKYRNINEVVLNGSSGSGFLESDNFVTRWNILGPIAYKAEKLSDGKIKSVLHSEPFPDEKKLTGSEKNDFSLNWQLARFESPASPGEINLRDFFKNENKYLIAYAVTYLKCEERLTGVSLYTGSSGYVKVWINHQLVHAYDHMDRVGKWDQDVIKNIELNKGYNLIVVKCVAIDKGWNFYLRFADTGNQPMKFIPLKDADE